MEAPETPEQRFGILVVPGPKFAISTRHNSPLHKNKKSLAKMRGIFQCLEIPAFAGMTLGGKMRGIFLCL
jgi:hypothetical protein